MSIRNPIEWGADQIRLANMVVGAAGHSLQHAEDRGTAGRPAVRRIGLAELWTALARGADDFAAYRTDVIFLCVVYPIVGILLARLVFGYEMLPLLFPVASGFALVGPFAAIGLYEMSRRREQGITLVARDVVEIVHAPAFGAILVLGALLVAIFLLWLIAAQMIYIATLGPEPPASIAAFAHDVLSTPAGWALIVVGIGVGFLFAVLVLAISVVSFPLLLDREVALGTAIGTSFRAVTENPGPMAVWGLIVAAALVVGSIPLFIGLIIVMPILGHATWHLYRAVVPR
ncbi:MAG: hypothetical protein JWL84_2207 [Rhodospirillales bacterium]|jgi:uncharacterized membrane protein|nr:hypothetical protein [Rhodospirillales bacterium]